MKNFNTGENPRLLPLDISHKKYCAVIEPDSAFWALVEKNDLGKHLFDSKLSKSFSAKIADYRKEMNDLRFNLKPSAVYFNPTDRCNLNCKYCYIPEKMRRNGRNMSEAKMYDAMSRIRDFFKLTLPKGRKAQIIFHGAEPTVNKEAMFNIISKFGSDFLFGIQSNGTLLDDDDVRFIKDNGVMIGLSMDGPSSKVSDKSRKKWSGKGTFSEVCKTLDKFSAYEGLSVICTMSSLNMDCLSSTVEFFHENGVRTCLLNTIRCTQPLSRTIKPDEKKNAEHFIRALDRSRDLYLKTGRKIVVANFANILLAILAPSGRKLMCDISPCGGGRCFFAVAASGDVFPCSEFIGVPEFKGGNIFEDKIPKILSSKPFQDITGRMVENIKFCKDCAIRNFCGSPCPAEAHTMNGGMDKRGAFCEFYEEQVRYAFRLIADGIQDDFLMDNWDKDMTDNAIDI
ncbi:MAG TPA: peptide-modifying radical SAM enzyme CbpB [Victivallales bacterium]|nr:peptide-modifying radical SAM enzyme CbpB [Victivallales bacterium]